MNPEFRVRMQRLGDNQAASPKSPVISNQRYEAICHHLQHPRAKVTPHFRHWVKTRQFQLVDLPGQEAQQLVIPSYKDKGDGTIRFLRVVHARQLTDVVWQIHAVQLNHGGYKKVLDYVQHHYFGVTRGFIQEFCKQCPVCHLTQSHINRPPGHPVIKEHFLDRVQVDLIDMSQTPDGDFHYIGHVMDHFSKFHILFPLKQNTTAEISRLLEERVLAFFGPPKIFQSSNGSEFVNQLICAMFERWGGDVAFVNGHLLHSQSEGLLENANHNVECKIEAKKQEEGLTGDKYPWAFWLPRIMFSINSEHDETLGDSPYHLVFGRSCPTGVFAGTEQPCLNEEGLEDGDDSDGDESLNVPECILSCD